MKMTTEAAISGKMILANDHYVAVPHDCTGLASLAENGVIPAGTIVPANDATAEGVLLEDVRVQQNPNGAMVMHGFLRQSRLPVAPTAAAVTALRGKGITILDVAGKAQPQKCTVTYDANGGTGTVTDSKSPYAYGATVTVAAGSGLTAPQGSEKTFQGWALSADAAAKDDAYDPSDTFVITANTRLYAVWGK